MDNLVSVIIPAFNQGQYVADALNSVLNQTHKNIEIICFNDGSTDNTLDVISSFVEKYKNISFISYSDNKGVVFARNYLVSKCNGEYILPLDADDTIEPTYIEKALDILKNNPSIGIVYCKARFFGNKNGEWILPEFNRSKFLYKNCIFSCALFRKKDFISVGGYKEYMSNGLEDYDLWLSFIEKDYDVYRIDEVLFNYRQYNEPSRNKIKKENMIGIWSNIIKNHLSLYLSDSLFYEKFFSNPYIGRMLKINEKKYRFFYKFFAVCFLISFLSNIYLCLF